MSLTSHLAWPQSPIARFLHERFPNTQALRVQTRAAFSETTTIRPEVRIAWGTSGTAIDYRLRYHFAVTPAEQLVAWHGARLLYNRGRNGMTTALGGPDGQPALKHPEVASAFFANLNTTLEKLNPSQRLLERVDEELLCRHCYVLALFEQVFRALPTNSPLFADGLVSVSDLLSIADDASVDDLCQMSWLFHERAGDLLGRPFVLNPTFAGSVDIGGADADLIVDGCLIDIKATVSAEMPAFKTWVHQLLGYVLLDYSDQYAINAVGFYLARQGLLLRWPISELLTAMADGRVPPLDQLRSQFKELVDRFGLPTAPRGGGHRPRRPTHQ